MWCGQTLGWGSSGASGPTAQREGAATSQTLHPNYDEAAPISRLPWATPRRLDSFFVIGW